VRRRAAAGVLAVLVACALVPSAPAAPAGGATADAGLVIAAIQVLEQHYVRPVQPVALVNAAIDSLRSTGPADLAEVSDGTPEASAERTLRQDFLLALRGGAGRADALAYRTTRDMLGSLRDSHTYYLDPAEFKERLDQIANKPSYAGVGTVTDTVANPAGGSRLYVAVVFPGSPAEASGLRLFDMLTRIGPAPVAPGATPLDVAGLLRGPAGSLLTVTVERQGRLVEITPTRRAIRLPVIAARVIRPGIGYLRLFQFSKGAGAQFEGALRSLDAQGPLRGMILDLRYDGGGYFAEVQPIAGAFVPPRTLLAHLYSRGGTSRYETVATPTVSTPLVVLTNGETASSAEVLSVALRDAHRATLVGETTAGALGSALFFPLPAGGMGVTVEEVDGPQYEPVEGVGVAPDRRVPITYQDVSTGKDAQLSAALRVLGGP